jgi:hypothetical protein
MISYSEKAKAHIEAQRIKEEETAAAANTSNTPSDTRAKLEELRRSFPSMIKEHKYDCKKGDIITYRHARPSGHFFDHSKAEGRVLGILYHGSSQKNIKSILRNGMHDKSYFTPSLDYAISRSKFKELRKEYNGSKVVEVLAMAVIVDSNDKLRKDLKEVKLPSREYSLPLYIITVQLKNP